MPQTPHSWLRPVLIWILVCLGVIFLYLLVMARNLDAISDIDALDYAQVARNLAEGNGFTTDFIKPLSLARIKKLDHHPDLIFSPLHPWLTSLFIRVMGATKQAVALACGLPFLLSLLVTYLFGTRLFERRVGMLGAALLGVNLWVLRFSFSGLEVCLLGLWVTILLWVLYRLATEPTRALPMAAAAGLLLGLIYLTKEIWTLILFPTVVYVWFAAARRRRWTVIGIMLGVFVVVILPWCLRMVALTGNPFFTFRWYEIMMDTMTNPGNTLYRSYRTDVQSPLTFMLHSPLEIYDKLHTGASALYGVLVFVAGPYTLAFFIVPILVQMGNVAFERLRYLVYATYVLLFCALCLVLPSARMMYPLAPIIAIIAAAFFFRVLTPLVRRYAPREEHRYTVVAVAVLMLVTSGPLLLNLTMRTRPWVEPPIVRAAKLAEQVAEATTGPIITDQPWLTAWYGKQTSIWLPRSWDDLERMQLDIGQVQYMLLTPAVAQWEAAERTGEWIRLWSAAQTGRPIQYRGFVVYRMLGENWILFRKAPELPSRPPGETGAPSGGG